MEQIPSGKVMKASHLLFKLMIFYSVLCLLGDYQTSIVVCCVVEFVLLDLL